MLSRVHAAGVDQSAWHLMAGLPYIVRLMGFGVRAPRTHVRAEAKLAPKPANATFEQAAAVPVSGSTALQALRDTGRLRSGQHVLVIGAGGGAGTFAVQLAKALGAEVTGVCSAAKADLVRALGAVAVIDYTREDFADGPQRYDLIVDTAGNRSLAHLRRAFVDQRLRPVMAKERSADLEALARYIEAGAMTPAVDRTYPLAEVPDAIRHLRSGEVRGKLVISVI